MRDSTPLEFSLYRATRTHEIIRCDREVVVPRSRNSPHLFILQQIRIDEDAQRRRMVKRRHTTFGFEIPLALELNFQLLGNLLATV
jgi:hypothetical protein